MSHPQTTLAGLDQAAADLATRGSAWSDTLWDDEAGLVQAPSAAIYENPAAPPTAHLVRETAWYALGLQLRDGPGDRERADRAVAALLEYQFDAPEQPYHGTWYRSPAEPPPPANPQIWRDYDPNWREFIGTTLAVLLHEYQPRLPVGLVARIDTALRRAIAGTIERDVPASYTNIALMCAFLLSFGAERFGEPAWAERAERLADAILARFRRYGTFDEYNSPTYYGVDLYALALWRSYAPSPLLQAAGAEIEAALWRDIAQFYHAGMRNMAGPYSRSYGMDMRRYVAGLGLWIWLATGYERAPFPDLGQPLEHGWDFAMAPLVALLGLQMPADARPHFLSFQGERLLERQVALEPPAVASAWVGERAMIGAADTGSRFRVSDAQFHPATIHWLAADGQVAWLRLRNLLPVDATAGPNRLAIVCSQHPGGELEFVFQIVAPAFDPAGIERGRWALPGLTIEVETEAAGPSLTRDGESVELRYHLRNSRPGDPVGFTLHTTPGPT